MKPVPYLPLALLLLTQCSKCKNDPAPTVPQPALPAETQYGARTFGCRLNGQIYANNSPLRVAASWGGCTSDCLSVSASMPADNSLGWISMGLAINSPRLDDGLVVPLLPARQTPSGPTYGSADATTSVACYYDGQRLVNGQVTLTRFDPVRRVAAGRFAFTLTESGCDTLRVTDGRFDVTF